MIKKKIFQSIIMSMLGNFILKSKKFYAKKITSLLRFIKRNDNSSEHALDVNTNKDWKKLKELYRRKISNAKI